MRRSKLRLNQCEVKNLLVVTVLLKIKSSFSTTRFRIWHCQTINAETLFFSNASPGMTVRFS
jgi:hypothetical protein